MPTFFEIDVQGAGKRVARAKWRVVDQTIPVDLGPQCQTVVDSIFGNTKLCRGVITKSRIIIEDIVTAPAITEPTPVTDKWQTRNSGDAEDNFRLSLPCLSPDNTLLATGSNILANLSDSRWAAYIAAVTNANFAYEDPDSGTVAGLLAALAVARSRVRPRQGST